MLKVNGYQIALQSLLFQNAKVKTIPHCIDLNAWEPIDKTRAKEILGIRKDIPCFGRIIKFQ